jgi:hypothetical protein
LKKRKARATRKFEIILKWNNILVKPLLLVLRTRSLILLFLLSFNAVVILNSQPGVFANGLVDQSWAPAGPPPGGNAIKYHEPIGQSFRPTLDNLIGVDVCILNKPRSDASETAYSGGNAIDFHSPIGQSFNPTYALFTGFEVYLKNNAGDSRTVTMNLRSGTIGGPIIGSKSFFVAGSSGWDWYHIDMPSPISVTPGSPYVIELVEPVGGVTWGAHTPGAYAAGNAIYNAANNFDFDNLFKTYGATDKIKANIRSGSIGGAIVGSSTVTVSILTSFTWTHIAFTQLSLTSGAIYILELIDPQGTASWAVSISGGYPDGNAIISGSDKTSDNWFRTYGAPSAAFSFSISLTTSSTVNITQGNTANWGVQVNLISGSTQPVTLTVIGSLPAGATSNTPIINSPSFTTTVSIATTTSTPPGTYPLTISASDGSLTDSTPIILIVNQLPPAPDFSISSSALTITITQGSSEDSTISITSLNGFNSPVILTASWIGAIPSGVTLNLPSPIIPPSNSMTTSTLTVTASDVASTGSYTLRITGTSGAMIHQVDITVQITSAPTTNGTTITTPTITITEQPPSSTPSFLEQIPGGAITLLIAVIVIISIIAAAASRRGHKNKSISR